MTLFPKHTRTPLAILALLACIPNPVSAQDTAELSSSKEPLEISADESLEWHRADKRFIARGNALAVQKPSSLAAQILTADYEEGTKGGGMQISYIKAQDDVVIDSQNTRAYGQQADYDLHKGLATMTGDNLRMESPDQTVTADDRFEYWVEEGRLNAIGHALVVRPNKNGGFDKLNADTVSAVFTQNKDGERVLETLEAKGNVLIITPTEKVTGKYGIYRANTNKAELTGGVTITRGPNILRGERAEVNMNTNTSTIFASRSSGSRSNRGRVTGIFYPGSEEKPQ